LVHQGTQRDDDGDGGHMGLQAGHLALHSPLVR